MFIYLKLITSKQYVKPSHSLTSFWGLEHSCSGQRNLKTFYGRSSSNGTKTNLYLRYVSV